MKKYAWLLTVIGVVVAALYAWRWYAAKTAIKDPSARDKDDLAATVYNANEDRNTARTVTSGILTPKASWVRPNGAIIDLNRLGGGVPELMTLPTLDPWN